MVHDNVIASPIATVVRVAASTSGDCTVTVLGRLVIIPPIACHIPFEQLRREPPVRFGAPPTA